MFWIVKDEEQEEKKKRSGHIRTKIIIKDTCCKK